MMFWVYLFGGLAGLFLLLFSFGQIADWIEHKKSYPEKKRRHDARVRSNASYYGDYAPQTPGHVALVSFGAFLIAALIAALVSGVLILTANAISKSFVSEDYETYNYLENIGDANGTRGSFSLFGGSIENQPVYMYYLRNDKGEFRLYHVDADSAYVTYTNETPKIVYHMTRSKNEFWALNAIVDTGTVNNYEFRVPEGSVKQNYNLDAQ
jgi:hypothetical protein